MIALRVTDDESRRVFHYLRNRSREWSLLNNVTWGEIGNINIHFSFKPFMLCLSIFFYHCALFSPLGQAFATVTCGGYIIVTAGLLVAAATGELRGRKTVCIANYN